MKTITRSTVAILLFLILILSRSSAQWQRMNGPDGGSVNVLGISGTTLLAGTDIGVYRSTDRGVSWTNPALVGNPVHAFLANGNAVFAGTDAGLYRSTDNGLSWDRPSAGLRSTRVNALAAIGSTLFAGSDAGLFRSTDGGVTWTLSTDFNNKQVTNLVVLPGAIGGTRLVVGVSYQVKSKVISFEPEYYDTYSYEPAGDIYSSTDMGTSWYCHASVKTGSDWWSQLRSLFSNSTSDADIYNWIEGTPLVAGAGRLFGNFSIDAASYVNYKTDIQSWLHTKNLNASRFIPAIPNAAEIFFVDRDGFLNRLDSTNTDATLSDLPLVTKLGYVGKYPRSVARLGSDMFVATSDRGIFRSADGGKTWTEANSGLANSNVTALGCLSTGTSPSVVAATRSPRGTTGNEFYGMYRTTDQGNSWSASVNGPPSSVDCIAVFPGPGSGQTLLMGSMDGVFASTDYGASWSSVSKIAASELVVTTNQGKATLYTAGPDGVYMTNDPYSSSWKNMTDHDVSSICTTTDSTGTTVLYAGGWDGLYSSSDNGNTWKTLKTFNDRGSGWGLPGYGSNTSSIPYAVQVVASGSRIFYLTSNGYIVHSTDGGSSFYYLYGDISPNKSVGISTFSICGSRLFAGTFKDGVFYSLDDGQTWTAAGAGLTVNGISAFAWNGTNLYVGTRGGGVFQYTGSLATAPSIAPTCTTEVAQGTPFLVEVQVGQQSPVTDLWDISFDISIDNAKCSYVDSSGTYGPFLTPGPAGLRVIPQTVVTSADPSQVHMYIKRMLSGGVTGSGVVAKAQFRTPPTVTNPFDGTFSVKNIIARNSKKERIEFRPFSLAVRFIKGMTAVWPGDCNVDGVVNANDILPLGVYFQKSNGQANNPGMIWQAYQRQMWVDDYPPKKVYADASGDGVINSADLLPIGLNYSKTHSVVVSGEIGPQNASLSKTQEDGQVSIVSVQRRGGQIRASLRVATSRPMYGLGFMLKYETRAASSRTLRFTQVDTSNSVLGGGLMFTMARDANGQADIAMTRIDGRDFTGDGNLLTVCLEAPAESDQNLRLEVCQVVSNDAKGNPLSISGSVYQHTATGISDGVPLTNDLLQNYPNPFNPSTLIRYELSAQGHVTLKIYDVLGREVASLVNEIKPAGRHSVSWDASSLASGVYFYTMTVNAENEHAFVQTRRMILVR